MEYHSPRPQPKSGTKRVASRIAPQPSSRKVPMRAWRTTRTTPDIPFRLNAEAMASRWDRPMRRRSSRGIRLINETNPSPPSWIMARITP